MRKFELTKSLFNKTLDQVRSIGGTVLRIHFVVGEMSELVPEKILEYWNDLSKETVLEPVELLFRFTEGEAQCMACFKTYTPRQGRIHCPHCGSFGAKILSGEEFYVEKIETAD